MAENRMSEMALLENRAQQGDAQAQFELGMHYAKGEGCKPDIQHAATLFEMAAEGGNKEAKIVCQNEPSIRKLMDKSEEAEPELKAHGNPNKYLSQQVARLKAILERLKAENYQADIAKVYERLLHHLQLALAVVPGQTGQACLPPPPSLKTVQFGSSQQVTVNGDEGSVWHGEELEACFKKPGLPSKPRKLFMVKRFLAESETESILNCARSSLQFQVFGDSVDGKPTYEKHVIRKHMFLDKDLEIILKPIVENRLLPYIRERYSIPDAVVCTCLLRRYLGEERRTHATHRDTHALCTAVMSLNAGDFTGGLYIQPELDSGSREFVPFECGDLAIHQSDLPHGVQVFAGNRYSLIFWFQDCIDSCIADRTPWKEAAALGGDPDAMCALASELKTDRSVELYQKAAQMGQIEAMRELGYLLHKKGLTEEACKFWQVAANAGDGGATRALAMNMSGWSGFPDLSKPGVEQLLVQAAERQELQAMLLLGAKGFACKNMSPQDKEIAEQWLLKAADLGSPEARYGLGLMHLSRARKERALDDNSPLEDEELQASPHFLCATLNGIVDAEFSWLRGMQEAWFPEAMLPSAF